MFGRLGAVRIKAAEDALAKGRLDEAFEIASAPDLTDNQAAQQLLARLAEPLLQRGQDLLLDRRFAEALADFERAGRCGCPAERLDEWRKRAVEAMQDHRQAEAARQAALAAARQRVAAGNLNSAAQVLARTPADDPDRAAVSEEIARRTRAAEEALAAAQSALKDGQLGRAVERVQAAKALHANLDGITDMENKLVEQAVADAAGDFKIGRLRRAEQDLAVLGDVGIERPARTELEEALRLAREAAKALADDRYAKAGVLLGRLMQIAPQAGWTADVREHLKSLEEHRRALLEGPLGLILGHEVSSDVSANATVAGHRATMDDTPVVEDLPLADKEAVAEPLEALPPARGPAVALPHRLLLRVDGAGSFLLIRGDRIGIGRSGPGATADLQLISDLAERQAEIVRAGEDYFVVASAGVQLADQQVDHALLHDGDRIRLGNRIRLKFLRPSQKSPTAVLDLGDGVRTTTDCRRVILWSGPLLLGGTRECHVRLDPGVPGMILLERDGRLLLKPMGVGGAAVPVSLGVQTEIGDLRLTVLPWSDATGTGRAIG